MSLTIEAILEAASNGQRIDPPYQRDAITILFDRNPETINAAEVNKLLDHAAEKHGVKLELVGGGAGCVRIIIVGEPKDGLLDLLTSDDFLRKAEKLGVQSIWSGEPGVEFRVDQYRDVDKNPRVDFALLTPLIEEFRPLRNALLDAACQKESKIQIGVMTYYKYDIASESGEVYRVVATFMPKMGTDSAAITTFHMLNDWRPTYILLGGIAGGIDSSDTARGDVVIADEVFRYDRRRKERAGGTTWAPSGYVTDRLLLNRAQSYLLEDSCIEEWAQQCLGSFEGDCDLPQVKVGNIACGDAVIDSAEFKNQLKLLNRTLCAIEMEGGGFLEAIINQAAISKALIVRGISDLAADKSASDRETFNWRGYAATNVANFLVRFIQQYNLNQNTRKPTSGETSNRPSGRSSNV